MAQEADPTPILKINRLRGAIARAGFAVAQRIGRKPMIRDGRRRRPMEKIDPAKARAELMDATDALLPICDEAAIALPIQQLRHKAGDVLTWCISCGALPSDKRGDFEWLANSAYAELAPVLDVLEQRIEVKRAAVSDLADLGLDDVDLAILRAGSQVALPIISLAAQAGIDRGTAATRVGKLIHDRLMARPPNSERGKIYTTEAGKSVLPKEPAKIPQ